MLEIVAAAARGYRNLIDAATGSSPASTVNYSAILADQRAQDAQQTKLLRAGLVVGFAAVAYYLWKK